MRLGDIWSQKQNKHYRKLFMERSINQHFTFTSFYTLHQFHLLISLPSRSGPCLTELNGQKWEFTEFVCSVSTLFIHAMDRPRMLQLWRQRAMTRLGLWLWPHSHDGGTDTVCVSVSQSQMSLRQSDIKLLQSLCRVVLKNLFLFVLQWSSLSSCHSPMCSDVTLSAWNALLALCVSASHWLSMTHLRHSARVLHKWVIWFIPISLSQCLGACTCAPAPSSIIRLHWTSPSSWTQSMSLQTASYDFKSRCSQYLLIIIFCQKALSSVKEHSHFL